MNFCSIFTFLFDLCHGNQFLKYIKKSKSFRPKAARFTVFFIIWGGFCFISFRKNRLSSQPAAVQSMIVPSFLTLHTIVDCIVPAKTRGTNCLRTYATIADCIAPSSSSLRSCGGPLRGCSNPCRKNTFSQ